MKIAKRVIALLLAAVLVFALAACNPNNNNPNTQVNKPAKVDYDGEPIKVAAIKGPTGMGMVSMMVSKNYEFSLISDPTEIVSLVSTGTVDIAACPLNLAANLYKKTNGAVKMIAVNTLGVLYFVTNGFELNSIEELKGKTVYSTGQGATPEFILNHVLASNNLKDEVKVEYLSEHSELAAKIASGDVQIAVLPEPFVTVATSKNANVKVSLSLTDEWNKVSPDATLAMGCVIARSDFIEKNPKGVEAFLADNIASVEYVNTKSLEASQKMVEKGIVDASVFAIDPSISDKKQDAAKLEKANTVISRCNIVLIDGQNMIGIANANFKVYFDADPKSIGGSLPENGLYYAK